MKVEREEMKRILESSIEKIIDKPDKQREVSISLYKEFNIPIRLSGEILGFTKEIEELGDRGIYLCYCILKTIDKWKVNKVFTDIEIKTFDNEKYPDDKITFPLKFNCFPVSDDQWIGIITGKELIGLGRNDLIRYEKDTQRVMKRIIRGENIFYRISLVKKAVREIKDLLSKNKYVPNTITLNIPLREDSNFYYDSEEKELIVKQIDAFNIIDGYHRYRAISDLVNEDENFNYGLELRITNFDNDKANAFIWQEDQKNRMAKVDSDSYNTNSLANRIVKRLNDHTTSLLNGQVYRNGGIIDPSDILPCIEYLYLKEKYENESQALVLISTTIIKRLNEVIENDYSIIQKKLEFPDVAILMYLVSKEDITANEVPDKFKSIKSKIDNKKFYQKKFGKRLYNYIESLV